MFISANSIIITLFWDVLNHPLMSRADYYSWHIIVHKRLISNEYNYIPKSNDPTLCILEVCTLSYVCSANMGSSQQCCYDDNDNLISGFGIGAGSSNLVATGGSFEHSIQHALQDVVPYTFCCFGTSPNCRSYFDNRPSSTGRGYRLRPPG